ncbi:cyclin-D5-1-like [Rhododendron vialii]|uniref:cyclin-D5-1-like n=1 Tax=Rhododendron vialii TaxID=182163 RepID=UPI00266018ED|nr:cyclin-D5-1-like [Rhododendron vialii]
MKFSLTDLVCHEDFLKKSELGEEEEEEEDDPFTTVSESEDEYIQLLIEEETVLDFNGSVFENEKDGQYSLHSDSWLKCARLGAINWVLSTRAIFGFQFKTALLSLTYFDRFLSKRSIRNGILWAIQLLSVACLSLAAKMEEPNAPKLSKYHVSGIEFPSNGIHKMELMVLTTLEWKLGSITPFAYLNYFTAKFCIDFKDCKPQELASTATELILAVPKEINLIDFRPSVIAFAAILAASDDQLTRNAMEIKMSVIPSLGSLPKDDVHSCYNLMLEIKMEKSSTPKSAVLSPNSSPVDVRENPLITSAVGTKRRLTYNGCDQNCPNLKNHRP